MTIFPLPLGELLGQWPSYAVYLLIGFAFGYILEIAGFGNAMKLAPQFYFKDLTVLKVMFGAIVTAMVLIFLASGVGLLDYNLIWVNPTYLWPGIVGGLVMGVGFILGGFCPGTSLVSAATLKVDGIFFVLGVMFGIFMFGETVGFYEPFWHSSYMGRFTLMDWLGLPTGVIVLLVVLMALFMFWGAEQLERIVGKRDIAREPKWRYGAAGTLVLGAAALIVIGQPTTAVRWSWLEPTEGIRLAHREVQIHPGELLERQYDNGINLIMLDLRPERDYNLFHLLDARRVDPGGVADLVPALHLEPENTLIVVMSADETAASEAWKILRAESVPNVYILEGGVNNWLATFADEEWLAGRMGTAVADDQSAYRFDAALGAGYGWAKPLLHAKELNFTPRIQMEIKRSPGGGGCG